MQLVGDVRNPALQRHFLRMANVWTAKAERGLAADTQESCFPKTSRLRSLDLDTRG
jgi:hypothetical protein